ncbi:MAG: hypothetical protein Cons2KO_32590 [Congregibacter sp.]
MMHVARFAQIFQSFLLLVGIIGLPFSASVLAQPTCDGLLFATGFDKRPTHGSKDALIAAVNQGQPVRVGWEFDFDKDGEADLSHWAEAMFLSVWSGEVFTQVDAIHTQTPERERAKIGLRAPYTEWRGSLGSDGTLEGRYSDNAEFPSDLHSRITWCSALGGARPWVLLYKNSLDGQSLAGSKEALFAAIRSGQPIQVAWGFKASRNEESIAVEHLASPVFLSIVNEQEVSAQLPEHIAQQHYADIDSALFDDPAVMWRGLVTTTGSFDAIWVNRATGKTVRRYPQRAAFSWYAPASPNLYTPSLAAEKGVVADAKPASQRNPE